MAQHDYVIDNQSFPATRSDLNSLFQAIASNNSGTTAPSTTYANQIWYDTANNKLYIRNEDNDAWIELLKLDQTNDKVDEITLNRVLQSSSTLASYHYTTWNPSDTSGTSTNAPATGTTIDSTFVSMANSSGTLTITFDVAGRYFICLTQQTNHAQVFTFDRHIATLGGTATREITRSPNNSGVPAIDSNFSVSTGFLLSATASQTLTILPTYELTGSGSTTSHAADFNVTIQYCGG